MNIVKRLPLQLLFIISLCAYSHTSISETGFTQPVNILAHRAESAERLRTIMQNINLTIHDSTYVDTQTDKINSQDMEDMIEVVEELLFYAEMMSSDVANLNFSEIEIVTYRELAGQLYTEALNIQQTANEYNLDNYNSELLDVNYRRLNEICAACHRIFRDKQMIE